MIDFKFKKKTKKNIARLQEILSLVIILYAIMMNLQAIQDVVDASNAKNPERQSEIVRVCSDY